MRNLCAKCVHWDPPKDKQVLCDVEGICRFRPPGVEQDQKFECLTEACGSCEHYDHNPAVEEIQDDSY